MTVTSRKIRESHIDYYIDGTEHGEVDLLGRGYEWHAPGGLFFETGAPVGRASFARMMKGYLPDEAKLDIAQVVNAGEGRAIAANAGASSRVGATDFTFSAPKSISAVFAACALSEERDLADLVADAQMQATREAIDGMLQAGAFEARIGKGAEDRVPARDVPVAIVPHTTSRNGDPQVHAHALIGNVGLIQVGETMSAFALDQKRLLQFKGLADAIYQVSLGEELRAAGLESERDSSGNLSVLGGDHQALLERLSSRREEVLKAAERIGYEREDVPREVKEKLFRALRKPKDKTMTPERILAFWAASFEAARVDAKGYMTQVLAAAVDRRALARAGEGRKKTLEAFREALNRGNAAFSIEEAQVDFWRAAIGHIGVAEAKDLWTTIARDLAIDGQPVLMQISRGDARAPARFSTPEQVMAEARLVRNAEARVDERAFLTEDEVRAVTTQSRNHARLTGEQKAAVELATLGRDGVCLLEVTSGGGKGVIGRSLAEVYAAAGYRVIGLSASGAGAGDFAREAGISESHSIQSFAWHLRAGSGKIQPLDQKTVILTDGVEAMGSLDVDLVHHLARLSGAKVVHMGDVAGLSSMQAGRPLSLLKRRGSVQSQAVTGAARQEEAWQREAVERLAAQGKSRETAQHLGIEAFRAHGAFHAAETLDVALSAIAVEALTARQAGESHFAIATRREDLTPLNEAIRGRLIEAGIIGAEKLTLSAKGRDGVVKTLSLAIGDDILFGEKLQLDLISGDPVQQSMAGLAPVASGDLARLIEVTGSGNEAVLRLRLARPGKDGEPVVVGARLSDLMGYRSNEDRQRGEDVPKLDHGYARTVNLAQSASADRVSVLNGGGLNASKTLVSLSRHRKGVSLHTDMAALASRHGADAVAEVAAYGELLTGTAAAILERPALFLPQASEAELQEAMIGEMLRASGNRTAGDHDEMGVLERQMLWIEGKTDYEDWRDETARDRDRAAQEVLLRRDRAATDWDGRKPQGRAEADPFTGSDARRMAEEIGAMLAPDELDEARKRMNAFLKVFRAEVRGSDAAFPETHLRRAFETAATGRLSEAEAKAAWEGLLSTGRLGGAQLVRPLERAGAQSQIEGSPAWTTPELQEAELRLLAAVEDLHDWNTGLKNGEEILPEALARVAGRTGLQLSDEQHEAVRLAIGGPGAVSMIEGSAGAGKSTVTKVIRTAFEDLAGYDTLGVAPSNRATVVLRGESGIRDTMSVQMLVARIKAGSFKIERPLAIFVDEAGMLSTEMLDQILDQARLARAQGIPVKVMMFGDSKQLSAVDAGSPFKLLVDRDKETGGFYSRRINTVRRQKDAWACRAVEAMSAGDIKTGYEAFKARGHVKMVWDEAEIDRRVDGEARAAWAAGKSYAALSYKNQDVLRLNRQLRRSWIEMGHVDMSTEIRTKVLTRAGTVEEIGLAVGDRVVFGERVRVTSLSGNHPAMDREGNAVTSRSDLATIRAIEHGAEGPVLTFELEGVPGTNGKPALFRAPLSALGKASALDDLDNVGNPGTKITAPYLQHAYAMTVHMSQGITVDRSTVLASGGFNASLTLVAMSRHREAMSLIVDKEHYLKAASRKLAQARTDGGTDLIKASPEQVWEAFEAEALAEKSNRNLASTLGEEEMRRLVTERLDTMRPLSREFRKKAEPVVLPEAELEELATVARSVDPKVFDELKRLLEEAEVSFASGKADERERASWTI